MGRYWAGTLARDVASNEIVAKAASLYLRDVDGTVKMVLKELSISNGLVWSKDARTMYYIDTPTAQIDALDFDPGSGDVSQRRAVVKGFDFETTGFPDGCAIDLEDRLWVARFNGGAVGCYDPKSGQLVAEVRVPKEAGRQVTSAAFGGETLQDLYLTTAREDFDEAKSKEFPLAGSLFVVPAAMLQELCPGVTSEVTRADLQVVAIEVKPALGNGVVTYATGLAFNSAGGAPLILSTCHMAYHDLTLAVAFGAGHGPVLEAEVMASTRLELSTEAFRSLASRGWRCGTGTFLDPSVSCTLQLHLLRPKFWKSAQGNHQVASGLRLSGATPCDTWIGRQVVLHGAPFGARVDGPGGALWSRFSQVLMRGVVSNLSTPPGLLLSDVNLAEGCAGGALILEDSNEVVALMAPSLRSSSGESVALSLAIPMSVILETLMDDDMCRAQLGDHDITVLSAVPAPVAAQGPSPPSHRGNFV
eukprot:symbB.v1.2.029198.t2/scaffold3170.1/size62039/2